MTAYLCVMLVVLTFYAVLVAGLAWTERRGDIPPVLFAWAIGQAALAVWTAALLFVRLAS